MVSSKQTKGLGNALHNARRKKADKLRAEAASFVAAGETVSKSVLEESNLDDLIATVEIRMQAYKEIIGDTEAVYEGPTLVEPVRRNAAELAASRRRKLVPIPRRPAWREDMDAEELAAQELVVFSEWRRGLALAAQEEGLHLTPYERNLDFWRQLWRCVERSDLVVQIVDARDPDFYFCHDLQQYVAETGSDKRLLLLVNKADFLSAQLRRRWSDHFAASGIDAVFFSALHELQKQQKEQVQQQLQERQHVRRGGEEELQQEEDDEDEEQQQQQRQQQQQQQLQRKNVLLLAQEEAVEDPAAVPVPGLDSSDDELDDPNVDGGGSSSSSSHADAFDEPGGSERSVDEKEEQEDEEEDSPLGPLDDCDRGIVNSSQLLDELASRLPERDDARQTHRGTIGFVGYPNVGKSTVINALVGAKKVGMSRTPGKTKHIQTLELPEVGVTLCDCPGLVFPSVAASRAHLVINNTMPLDDLKECHSPVTLIIDKMGLSSVLERYGCAGLLRAASERTGSGVLNETRSFLTALALSRGHLLRAKVPDEDWAARKVLRDYVVGRLLHCEEPPEAEEEVDGAEASCGAEAQESHGDAEDTKGASSADPAAPAAEEEDDFGDVQDFLLEASKGSRPRGMTKRQMRFMNKQCMKGGGMPQTSGTFAGGICSQRLADLS